LPAHPRKRLQTQHRRGNHGARRGLIHRTLEPPAEKPSKHEHPDRVKRHFYDDPSRNVAFCPTAHNDPSLSVASFPTTHDSRVLNASPKTRLHPRSRGEDHFT